MLNIRRFHRQLPLVVLVFAIFFAATFAKVVRLQEVAEQNYATTSLSQRPAPHKCKFSFASQTILDLAVVANAPKWKRPIMITNFYAPPYTRLALDRPTVPLLRPPIRA